MRKYRFFYHYYKQKKKMSVHFRGKCHIVDSVSCIVPCYTKWNKTQPIVVMQGHAKEILINKGNALII